MTTSTVENLVVSPVDEESMTKDEIRQHLREHHKSQPYNHNTKTPKTDLVAWHDRVHGMLDTGTESEQRTAANCIRQPHVHRILTTEDVTDEGGVVLNLTKPLTAAEAKDLRGLIDNDFNRLVQDMKAMAADTKAQRLADAEKEWSRKVDKSEFYRDQARKMLAKFDEQVAALKEKALGDGIELTVPMRYSVNDPSTTLVGKSLAMQAITTEVQNDLNRALMTLEKQRLVAHRTVILAKITPEAHKVLQSVPDAQTLMVEAARERQQKEVGA